MKGRIIFAVGVLFFFAVVFCNDFFVRSITWLILLRGKPLVRKVCLRNCSSSLRWQEEQRVYALLVREEIMENLVDVGEEEE